MSTLTTARRYPKPFVEHLRHLADTRPGDIVLTVVGKRDGRVADTPIHGRSAVA